MSLDVSELAAEPTRVGFTGTQRGMTEAQKTKLRKLMFDLFTEHYGNVEFRHGDCIGADADAHDIAVEQWGEERIWIHPPRNDTKRAWCSAKHVLPVADYLDRNHDIVDASGLMVATPSGYNEELRSGTWATIRYARKRFRPLTIIWPDGTTQKETYR